MNIHSWLLYILAGVLMLVLLTACSTIQPSPEVDISKTSTAEVVEWDFVSLGDSLMWETSKNYAKMIEEDLGITIDFHIWPSGGDTSSRFLNRIRTNEQLRQILQEAEVITFNIPVGVVRGPMETFGRGEPGACGGEDNMDCLREAFSIYLADIEPILAEIVSLRSPTEALIRVQDTYGPKLRETIVYGSDHVYREFLKDANERIRETAAIYGIPVVGAHDALMGEGSMTDPRDLGLVGSDGIHLTREGSMLLAELFRAVGYEFAEETP